MRKADFIGVIFAACLLLISPFFFRGGSTVSIYVDGRLYAQRALSENTTVAVSGKYGKNTVCIKDKSVYITKSDCPGKQCMHGKISACGQSLVCLPHRLSVVIENTHQKNETDVIL